MTTRPGDHIYRDVEWVDLGWSGEGNGGIPVATHRGVLRICGVEMECFQLSDGRRVISEDGLAAFFRFLEAPE